MIRVNLNMFSFAEILTYINQNTILEINSVSNAKKIIKDLKWHFWKDECQKL